MNRDAWLLPESADEIKFLGDITLSLIQIFLGVTDTNPDVLSHLDSYHHTIDVRKKKLIIVAHSAGNLYANKEFNLLAANGSIDVNRDVSLISVASPSSFVAPFAPGIGPYRTLHEDLIASNYVFPVVNPGVLLPNATNLPDFVCAQTTAFVQSLTSCHDFVKSYLGRPIETKSGRSIVDFVLAAMPVVASSIDDDFNNNSINTSLWTTVIVPAAGGTVREVNQRVEMVALASGDQYLALHGKCQVHGDFDVQVDFRLLNWPAVNFHSVRLAADALPQGPGGLVGMIRNSYNDENYQFRTIAGVAAQVNRPDFTGTLRLKRTGSMIQGYLWDGTQFILVGSSQTTTDDTGFVIDFAGAGGAPITPPANVSIAFDNFRATFGSLAGCQP